MNPNDLPEAGWLFDFSITTIKWLNPAILLAGLGIATWAFYRCRKWGYLLLAFYFALAAFELLAMPAIYAHRQPSLSEQTEQKIAVATQEAIHKILVEEGLSYPPRTRNISFPLGQILLVGGLWLLARRETPRPNAAPMPSEKGPGRLI
jgi:hypothetical protein